MCRPSVDFPPYELHPLDCSRDLPYRHPIGSPGCVLAAAGPIDPEPDYDGPDPEPDYDTGDVPPGACLCHDAAVCPTELLALAEREPLDVYRDRP